VSDTSKAKTLGRVMAIDIGTKRIGVAVCDELRIAVRPLPPIQRGSWKHFLQEVRRLIAELEASALVIGMPLRLDGSEGDAATSVRQLAEKFGRSLSIPVYLQDERLTTLSAKDNLKAAGRNIKEIAEQIDSEAAAIILRDFINNTQR